MTEHKGREIKRFMVMGDVESAASGAEDEFTDIRYCLKHNPASNAQSQTRQSLLQLMGIDCPGRVGNTTSVDPIGQEGTRRPLVRLPFSSSLVMDTTSGSGSTSSGKQKQKSASESSSSSGGGGSASQSQSQSQQGGRHGGLGSESSDSDDNDDDERKRRPPRDLKKEPKTKEVFADEDDEATDSADEGADPVIDCDATEEGQVNVSSEPARRSSKENSGRSVTSTVTIESKEVSMSSPGPVNMSVGYGGVLEEMPPRIIDKDSPESTLAGTPVLDSPRPLQGIESEAQSPHLFPEVVSIPQVCWLCSY